MAEAMLPSAMFCRPLRAGMRLGEVGLVRRVRHHGADLEDDSVDEGLPFGFVLGRTVFPAELGNSFEFLEE